MAELFDVHVPCLRPLSHTPTDMKADIDRSSSMHINHKWLRVELAHREAPTNGRFRPDASWGVHRFLGPPPMTRCHDRVGRCMSVCGRLTWRPLPPLWSPLAFQRSQAFGTGRRVLRVGPPAEKRPEGKVADETVSRIEVEVVYAYNTNSVITVI